MGIASKVVQQTLIFPINHAYYVIHPAPHVLVILFSEAPLIGFIFLGWAILYIFINALFIRQKIKYDLLEAAADSKVTAHFADAFTNILNIIYIICNLLKDL